MIESALHTSGSEPAVSASMISESLLSLAEGAATLTWSDVPIEVQDRTLLVLFDTLGVMLAGARTDEVLALAEQVVETGDAPLVGLGRTGSAGSSCWINGMAVCILELDEGSKYARGHPAAHVVPVALAVGKGHTGSDWLAAVLAGYEIAARFGRATKLRDGVHPHGTWGVTGAAAVAAKLAGLDSERLAAAVDASSGLTLAPPFESAFNGHPVRDLWIGAANGAGLNAARLAAAGIAMAGETAPFTFGRTIGELDPLPLTVPFHHRWEILGGYFKRHAACAYTHSAADAVLELRDEVMDTSQIEAIAVETYPIAATLDRTEWPTRLAAMFSIPYVVAVTLVDGSFGPEATSVERRRDPEVLDLALRVELKATSEFGERLPEERGARVTLRMGDGSLRSARVDQPVGDAAYHPFGWEQLRSKLDALIGAERTARLEGTIRALPAGTTDGLIEGLVWE